MFVSGRGLYRRSGKCALVVSLFQGFPSLLSDPEAKKAYDRLASAKFQRHDCATHQPVAFLNPESFIARAKGLIMRGFKPKDAAEIAAREITFENQDDPDIARKVQIEVNDFLRRVKG